MDEFGFQIITEEELDELFDEAPSLPPGIVPGINIKTGCYGLFLIALDKAKTKKDIKLFNDATEALDTINNDVALELLTMFYPPNDLEYNALKDLANVILMLYKIAGNNFSIDKLHAKDLEWFEKEAIELLGFREGVIELLSQEELTKTSQELLDGPETNPGENGN